MNEIEFLEDLNALVSGAFDERDIDPMVVLRTLANEIRERIAELEAQIQ